MNRGSSRLDPSKQLLESFNVNTIRELKSTARTETKFLAYVFSTSQAGQQAKSLGLCPKVGSKIHLFSSRRLGCSRILQTSKRLAGGVHVCSLEKGAYSQVRFVTPGCCGSVPKRPKRGVAAPSRGSSEFAASRSNPRGPPIQEPARRSLVPNSFA